MWNLLELISFKKKEGQDPMGPLVLDAAGDIFGMAQFGGPDGDGVAFEIAKTKGGYAGRPTVLSNFDGSDGSFPYGGLTIDAAGNLFGATDQGGPDGYGEVFELPDDGDSYSSAPSILGIFDGADGSSPNNGLIADAEGDLFGTTVAGGAYDNGVGNGDGVVFEIMKTATGYDGTPTVLVNFNLSDGASPVAGLIADSAGDLLGTASGGGADGDGEVFEIAKSGAGYAGAPTILANFSGANGNHPDSGLIADAEGDLFGETLLGGAHGDGEVYEIVNTGAGYAATPTVLASFTYADGFEPIGGLISDSSGDLFGVTQYGGADGYGELFEIAKTRAGYASQPIVLYSFDGANGAYPFGAPTVDAAGDLVGATQLGGAQGDGSVFVVTSPLVVKSVKASPATGVEEAGDVVRIHVDISEAVDIAGDPKALELTLNDGGVAHYSRGDGTNTLDFRYKVAAGDESEAALAVVGLVNGFHVEDASGNVANLFHLPTTFAGLSIDTGMPQTLASHAG